MDGILEKFVKALIELLKAIAKAILELMNMFIDWIWKAIKGMVNPIFQPIKDAIKNFVRGVTNCFMDAILNHDSSYSEDLIKIVMGPFYWVLNGLMTVMKAIFNIIKPFLELIGDLIQQAINFISNLIKGAMGGGSGSDNYPDEFNNYDLNDTESYLSKEMTNSKSNDISLSETIIRADILSIIIAFILLLLATGGTSGLVGEIIAICLSITALFIDTVGKEFIKNYPVTKGLKPIPDNWAGYIASSIGLAVVTVGLILSIITPVDGCIIDGALLLWNGFCFTLCFLAYKQAEAKITGYDPLNLGSL